jgi:addiction module HigA family antidote
MKELYFSTPGEILREEFLKPYNMSVESLAKEINLPEKTILDLIAGEEEITEDIAKIFSNYFGTSFGFWMNLQKEYNERTKKNKNKSYNK